MSGKISSGGSSDDDELIADINMTPMVDIMLVLLIIFMVTANLISNPDFHVDLPKATTRQATKKIEDLSVSVTRQGTIRYMGQDLTPERLLPLLRAAHKRQPQARVLIMADSKSYHERVIKVMETARLAGIERIGIATKTE